MSLMPKCRKCQTDKPEDGFSPSAEKYGWIRCKDCENAYRRRLRKGRGRQKYLASKEDYKKKHPEQVLLEKARKNAKRSGHSITLKISDIWIPDKCPALGCYMLDENGHTVGGDCTPSIDRFDSNKGYTPENIRIISWRANNVKGNATVEELEAVAAWMRRESHQPTTFREDP